jgi:hypothetical protein
MRIAGGLAHAKAYMHALTRASCIRHSFRVATECRQRVWAAGPSTNPRAVKVATGTPTTDQPTVTWTSTRSDPSAFRRGFHSRSVRISGCTCKRLALHGMDQSINAIMCTVPSTGITVSWFWFSGSLSPVPVPALPPQYEHVNMHHGPNGNTSVEMGRVHFVKHDDNMFVHIAKLPTTHK